MNALTLTAREDRLLGGLYGLLIGDALGVPYEFNSPEKLPDLSALSFVPPAGFARTYPTVPPGTWSDDGAQALCLLESLLAHGGQLDLEDLGRRLYDWYAHGHLAVDRRVFDVGIQTAQSLQKMAQGQPAARCGGTSDHSNGNGSLMRVLPLVLVHQGPVDLLIAQAHRQSQVTHAHPRAQACCALYCLWAWFELQQHPEPWPQAVQVLTGYYARMPEGAVYQDEVNQHLRPLDHEPLTRSHCGGSGYVVDSLRSARWACQAEDYWAVMRRAIGLGHDTDTTACIAGGIAGLRCGLTQLPTALVQGLRGQTEWLAPLQQQLLCYWRDH